MIERIATLARRQEEHLEQLKNHALVRGARQVGTITALDVGEADGYLSDLAPRMLAMFRERGVLLRPLGNTVYVMPPYCITAEQLARVYGAIAEVLDALAIR